MTLSRWSSHFGNLKVIHRTIQSYGLDADEIVRLADIDMSLYENTTQRIPGVLMDRLYELAYEKTGDESFGLRAVDYLSPASYHALGVALLYSSTLRAFFHRYVRFFDLISTLVSAEFHEEGDPAYLSLIRNMSVSEYTAHFDSDAFVASVVKFVRLVNSPEFNPARVELDWMPPKENHSQYENLLRCEIRYNCDRTAIYFSQEDLDRPLLASNRELARQNDNIVVEYLTKMKKVDLPSRVHVKIAELLPTGDCSRVRVAKELNMSASALHDKLKRADTSYQEIFDESRKELAETYMAHVDLSISEVAYLLGFADSSNFSRAFRRWLGVSPRDYRHNLMGTSARKKNRIALSRHWANCKLAFAFMNGEIPSPSI